MSKEMIVSATSVETKVAIIDDDQVTEIFIERARDKGILGNIYKGRVTRVLPGMQAAFVDIGLDRDAFLYVSDFFEDIEEYEQLFSEVEEKVEKLLEAEDREKSEPEKAPPSQRARSRRQRTRKRRHRGAGQAPAGGVRNVTPPAERTDRTAAPPSVQSGDILVEEFPVPELPQVEETQPAKQGPAVAGPEILPERIETVVQFEPEQPAQEPLPDGEARIEGKGEVHHLTAATKKGASRSRRRRPSRRGNSRRTSIGDLLREGQEILVQVAKEPISKKGARITSHVALPGRYVVFMPTVDHVGVSRKILSEKERQRLRDATLKLRGDSGKGFIIRTAGENRSEADFGQDMAYLTRLWADLRAKAERASAPALVHSELGLVQRILRDHFSEEYRAIRVDDEHEYERIVEFVSKISPAMVNRVRLYNKRAPIFDEYGVTAEIERALKQKVWLKNGGYIVINQTEALVAIDVNTGKFVGKTHSLEDTITKTNLDAVKEVVRQIRLRDLGGILVIDFIDMDERRNQQKVMEALQQELAQDKSPSKILQFNEFGLVAITRKRVKQSLERTLCQPCSYCNGSGMTKSVRTVCSAIHQEVRRMAPHFGEGAELMIRCHPEVGKALRERERAVLTEIEEMSQKAVTVKTDPIMHIEQFDLVET